MSSVQSVSLSKVGKMGESIFADDSSFEEQFKDPEERLDVVAPAGKLGMVIDTPNGGIPVVHAIKDTSVLIDDVRVGDRLLSVDGEDCTVMTAMQVSKLISLKSNKPARVLVFARTPTKNLEQPGQIWKILKTLCTGRALRRNNSHAAGRQFLGCLETLLSGPSRLPNQYETSIG